jgi:hypothetical protein
MSLLSQAELESQIEQRAAALRARLDAPPAESWRPEKPELGHARELVGVFQRYEEGQDRGFGKGQCAVLRESSGQDWRVWLRAASKGQFERQLVAAGDLVAIRYEGYVEPRAEKPGYHAFRVEVDRAPAAELAPSAVGGLVCEQCGCRDPEHAVGCPAEVPF